MSTSLKDEISNNSIDKPSNIVDSIISYDKNYIPTFTTIFPQVGESNSTKAKTLLKQQIPRSLNNRLKVYDVDFGDERFREAYYTTDPQTREVVCDICLRNNKKSKMNQVKPLIYKCRECGVHKNIFQFTNFQRFLWSFNTSIVYAFTTVGTGKTTGNIQGLIALGMRFSDQQMLIVTPNSKLGADAYSDVINSIPDVMIKEKSKSGKKVKLTNGTTFMVLIAAKGKEAEDFKSFNFSSALIIEGSSDIYWEAQEAFNGKTLLDLIIERVRQGVIGTGIKLESNMGEEIQKPTNINKVINNISSPMTLYKHNKIIIEVNPKDTEMLRRMINRVDRVYISKTAVDVNLTVKLINDLHQPAEDGNLKNGVMVIATTIDNPNYRYFNPSYLDSLEQKAKNIDEFNTDTRASLKNLKPSIFSGIEEHFKSTRDIIIERGLSRLQVLIAVDPGGNDPYGIATILYWDYGGGNVIYHIYKSFQSERKLSLNYIAYYKEIKKIEGELLKHGISTPPNIVFDDDFWKKNQEDSGVLNSKGETTKTSSAKIMMEKTGLLLHKAIKGRDSVWKGFIDMANLFNEGVLTIDSENNRSAIKVFKIITQKKLLEKSSDVIKLDHTTDAVRYLFQNEIIEGLQSNKLYNIVNFGKNINKETKPINKQKKQSFKDRYSRGKVKR